MTSSYRRERRLAQLRRRQEQLRAAEQPLREAVATMHATIERWRAESTELNRRAAWAATGLVAEDEMATFAAYARTATLTADGVLPDEVVKQMWHTVADLERAHAATLQYFRQLEQTELPDQTTARIPLQPAGLDQILALWPQSAHG